MAYELVLTREELGSFVEEVFSQAAVYNWSIDDLIPGEIFVSMKTGERDIRPGGTISGPTMFALADIAAYLLVLGHVGKVALAVTTNLNINFLNKPEPGDIKARAKFLKLGKRLAVCEIWITSNSSETVVAQATATYSIPPR